MWVLSGGGLPLAPSPACTPAATAQPCVARNPVRSSDPCHFRLRPARPPPLAPDLCVSGRPATRIFCRFLPCPAVRVDVCMISPVHRSPSRTVAPTFLQWVPLWMHLQSGTAPGAARNKNKKQKHEKKRKTQQQSNQLSYLENSLLPGTCVDSTCDCGRECVQ